MNTYIVQSVSLPSKVSSSPPKDSLNAGLPQSMPVSKSKGALSKTKEKSSDESSGNNDFGFEEDEVEVIQDSLPLDDSPEMVRACLCCIKDHCLKVGVLSKLLYYINLSIGGKLNVCIYSDGLVIVVIDKQQKGVFRTVISARQCNSNTHSGPTVRLHKYLG